MNTLRIIGLIVAVTAISTFSQPTVARTDTLQETSEELAMAVGENRVLSASKVKSYSEGSPGIVDVRLTPDNRQFVVVGKRPGATTLLLIKEDGAQILYRITVFPLAMERVRAEVGELLEGTTGLRVRRVGPRLFIEGGVSNEAELKRIERVAELYKGQVESLVTLGGAAAERKINVRLDIYFVQFDRHDGYQVGVSWPTNVGPGQASVHADLLSRVYTDATAQVVDQALPGLDLAATNGWAKVLKHSTVITANGSEAQFSSGGEQNYRVVGGLAAELKSLNFGTDVKVTPLFDSHSGELEVRVAVDVSDLTAPTALGADLPGRSTTKLDTRVSLKIGQGLVLSGIRSYSHRHAVSGIPLLSEIPLLGVLFGSHQNQEDEVDGAIYMIPSVLGAVSMESEQLMDELFSAYGSYDGSFPASRLQDLGNNAGGSE